MISGKGTEEFLSEAGGHRVQRVPPTERKGRTHTSTVTVAALEVLSGSVHLDPRDVDIQTTRGSGPGGQHRNTTDSCVLAIHRPTGLSVRIDGRSQIQNRKIALEILATRLEESYTTQERVKLNQDRRGQVGSGQRGDKIRTYREKDNLVVDHRSGKKWQFSRWMNGIWD